MSSVVKSVISSTKKLTRKLGDPLGLAKETPKVSTTAEDTLSSEAETAKKSRAALYATEGGAAGEELSEGSTSRRKTLLGN